jgi:hypothetical protein
MRPETPRKIGEKTVAITETKETQETTQVRAQPEPLYTNNQFDAAYKALNAYNFGDGWKLDETDERWTQAATGTELSIGASITKTVDGKDAPERIYEDVTYKASFDPIDRTLTNAVVVDRQGQTWGAVPPEALENQKSNATALAADQPVGPSLADRAREVLSESKKLAPMVAAGPLAENKQHIDNQASRTVDQNKPTRGMSR